MLTVFCVWLGWNVNAVQKRKALLGWANNRGVKVNEFITSNKLPPALRNLGPSPPRRMPRVVGIGWFRRTFLDDQPVETIWIPGVWRNEMEVRQIDEAFPEAEIMIGQDR